MPYTKLRPDSYVHHTLHRYTGSEHMEYRRYVLLDHSGVCRIVHKSQATILASVGSC